MGEIMLFAKKGFSFISASIFIASLALTGCSSLPWSDEQEDEDLFFEEDFGSEFESELKDAPTASKEKENDFFADDKKLAESSPETEPQLKGVPVSPDEEDFFFEDDKQSAQTRPKAEPKPRATPQVSSEEDDFFKDDEKQTQTQPKSQTNSNAAPSITSEEDDFFFEDEPMARNVLKSKPVVKPQSSGKIEQTSGVISNQGNGRSKSGGFVSVDQKTDKEEMNMDVASLRSQQEELMFRVQELQKIVSNLEPRLAATQERVNASLSAGSGTGSVNSEIQFLKSEVIRLKSEIASLKRTPTPAKQAKMIRKARAVKKRPKISRAPKKYNEALAAYKSGAYDKSILLFQEMSLANPPENLRDNIVFWMGSNYLKLDMYDDAIKQYESVLTQYPDGNKVHDARYMLGVCYQKKGDTGRALDALEVALKSNPPSEVRKKIERQLMEIK
jgi:TolA-binding protein